MSSLPGDGSQPIQYLPTQEAYAAWSSVYDTDGNFLQALDSYSLKTLLPQFLSYMAFSTTPIYVDLGCGTGRGTLELIRYLSPSAKPGTAVYGLDASAAMLEIARSKLAREIEGLPNMTLSLSVYDILHPAEKPPSPPAEAMISTLVLEHIPLRTFFVNASRLLAPGGIFLVTNMHAEMGRISQAGFIDPQTGHKVRAESYAHKLDDVVGEAKRQGLEVIEGLTEEKSVGEEMVELLGERSQKWVGGIRVWFSVAFKKIDQEHVVGIESES